MFKFLMGMNGRRRAHMNLSDVCNARLKVRKELAQLDSDADRALRECLRIEQEQFRIKFEKRDLVRSAFLPALPGDRRGTTAQVKKEDDPDVCDMAFTAMAAVSTEHVAA